MFINNSVQEFENYLNLEMIQIMFDHNLQYPEFVYIFEEGGEEPDTERLERHMTLAAELRDKTIEEFKTKLEDEQKEVLRVCIQHYVTDLKTKEKKNGGFPNNKKMIGALVDTAKYYYNYMSNKNVDQLKQEFQDKFMANVQNKLDLDHEALMKIDEQMAKDVEK